MRPSLRVGPDMSGPGHPQEGSGCSRFARMATLTDWTRRGALRLPQTWRGHPAAARRNREEGRDDAALTVLDAQSQSEARGATRGTA